MEYYIHPHVGFVNTQFTIWSDNQEVDFSIKDTMNGELIYVPRGKVKVNRSFSVGEHKLLLYNEKGELIQEETIVVKPSIKVGGSTMTGCYILPSWIIMVMKDRTYFYNRKTEQEFSENNVYPIKIEEITPDILCLKFDYYLHFYKLPGFKSIFERKSSFVKYYNAKHILYIEGNKLMICNYSNATIEYPFESYYIDEDGDMAYVYNDKKVYSIDLRDLCTNEFNIDAEYNFISFLSGCFIIFQDNNNEIYVYDFIERNIYKIDIINELLLQERGLKKLSLRKAIERDEIEVYDNGKKKINLRLLFKDKAIFEVLLMKRYDKHIGSDIYSGFSRDIYIFDYHEKMFHIEKLGDVFWKYSDNDVIMYTSFSLNCSNKKNAYIYNINLQTYSIIENISLEQYDRNIYFIGEESDDTIIYNCFGTVLLKGQINKINLGKYGLVSICNDKTKRFYYLDKEKVVESELIRYPLNSYIVLNNNTYYYKRNKLYPLPFKVNIIREKDNCILYEENEALKLLEWNDTLNKYETKTIFLSLERGYYEKVYFTSDARKLLCEDKNGKFKYYDIEKNEFVDFDLDIPTVWSKNANQPILDIKDYRNPQLVDPISLKPISSKYLQDYEFSDASGRYICNTNYVVNQKEKTKYICVKDTLSEDEIKIEVKSLHYLNYISFSCDSKYISIVGATTGSGYIQLYDLEKKEIVFVVPNVDMKIPCPNAVWVSGFDKNNNIAFYNSIPNTYIINLGKYINNDEDGFFNVIRGRSFLCFSTSGKYLALSVQGYTAYATNSLSFGHKYSTNVYIRRMDNLQLEIGPFDDFGCSSIKKLNKTTACAAAFSSDDSKLLVIGSDGTFVIRDVKYEFSKKCTLVN